METSFPAEGRALANAATPGPTMSDDARERLGAILGLCDDHYVIDAIAADPKLLVVARPTCDGCDGLGGGGAEGRCPDCDGTGYTPIAAVDPATVLRLLDLLERSRLLIAKTSAVSPHLAYRRELTDLLLDLDAFNRGTPRRARRDAQRRRNPIQPGDTGMSYHDEFGPDLTPEELEVDIIARLPELLRSRCCRNEDHCGPDPAVDHGHTDCWFMGLAAREIERLRDRTFWDRVAKGRVRPSTSKPERW